MTPSSESPGNISLAASPRGDWRAILWRTLFGVAREPSPEIVLITRRRGDTDG